MVTPGSPRKAAGHSTSAQHGKAITHAENYKINTPEIIDRIEANVIIAPYK
jgi:hypothetical protein